MQNSKSQITTKNASITCQISILSRNNKNTYQIIIVFYDFLCTACNYSLVNGDEYYLPDASITASSTHSHCQGAHNTRYMESDGTVAWCTGM